MNIKNNHLVIMAGGVGSRFWPMSTPDYPKQFIDVLGCGRTLIQSRDVFAYPEARQRKEKEYRVP